MPVLEIKPSSSTALIQGNLSSFPFVWPSWQSMSWVLRCHLLNATALVLNLSHTPTVVDLPCYTGDLFHPTPSQPLPRGKEEVNIFLCVCLTS